MVERRRAPRRAPDPDAQSPDDTRERILDAAVAEFGAHGYAGARTAGIARRAGVNQQLISYYFGGKQGVLDELRRRWAETEEAIAPGDTTFGESLAAHLDATLDRPDWARLLIWRALGDDPGYDDEQAEAARSSVRRNLERVRARQAAGEIRADVDAEYLVLLSYALTFAPITLPHVVETLLDVDPTSPQYRREVVDQLVRLTAPAPATDS